MSRLEEIRARLGAATPGPWQTGGSWHYIDGEAFPCVYPVTYPEREMTLAIVGDTLEPSECIENAEFIAHAPADVAFLLEDNARLRELLGIAWEIIDRAPWKYAGEVWKRDAAAWSEARSALDADR